MTKTTIQYCTHTVNPIRAHGPKGRSGHYCEKISPGCKNCYASNFQPRFGLPRFNEHSKTRPPMYLDEEMLEKVLKRRAPATIFWCDMTDMFGEWVLDSWIIRCFAVMAATSHLTHLVLTKRAYRLRALEWMGQEVQKHMDVMFPKGHCWSFKTDWPLKNVRVGVSAENQAYYDGRIDHLMRAPAACRWVSFEPLLGRILVPSRHLESERGIDWGVVGLESGRGARPGSSLWVTDIRDKFNGAGKPFFFKQWGQFALCGHPFVDDSYVGGLAVGSTSGVMSYQHGIETGRLVQIEGVIMERLRKKNESRVLYGREWNETP